MVVDEAISVRLDSDGQLALARLTKAGVSESQAISEALILAARQAWHDTAEADAKRLAASPRDRAEVAAIRKLFDGPDASL